MVWRVVPLMIISLAGNASPSWSAQPTKKLSPGPWTMLVGMQFSIGTLFMTTGPLGLPGLGSISSMEPTFSTPVELLLGSKKWPVLGLKPGAPRPAGPIAPVQGVGEVVGSQFAVAMSIIGPWWQGMGLVPVMYGGAPEAPEFT